MMLYLLFLKSIIYNQLLFVHLKFYLPKFVSFEILIFSFKRKIFKFLFNCVSFDFWNNEEIILLLSEVKSL